MLRITVHNDDAATRFTLEGRLMGAWARELESCWRQATANPVGLAEPAATRVLVELNDVDFVDEEGRALLKLMAASGVELIAIDVLMKALVEEITEGGRIYEKAE